MQISLYFLIHIFTSIFLFFLFFRTIKKLHIHAAKELSIGILCCAVSSLATAMSIGFIEPDFKFFWHESKFLGVAFIPIWILLLYLRFLKKDSLITKRNVILLFIIPIITVVLAWTNKYHHFFRDSLYVVEYDGATFVAVESNFWYWIHSAYLYAVLVLALIILWIEYFRTPIIFRTQIRIILFGSLVSTAINIVSIMGIFNDYWDMSVLAPAFGASCSYLGICRFTPNRLIELARNLAINNIKSCIFIFDLEGVLLDANTYAKEEFNISNPDFGKLSFNDFVKNSLNISKTDSLDTMEFTIKKDEIKHYRLTDTPLYDSNKMYIGRVLVLNNVTNVKQKVNDLQHIVSHDYLTNLYNSNQFVRQIDIINDTEDLPISVIHINVDKMRIFNRVFSFDYGDKVIKCVAKAILLAAKPNGLCFRVGGDEFTILLPSTNEIRARQIKDKIFETYQANLDIDISVNFSYCIGTKSEKSQNLQSVLNEAIKGMHSSKAVSAKISNAEIYSALNNYFVKNKYKTEGHVERIKSLCSTLSHKLDFSKEQHDNLQLLCSVYDIGIISTSTQLIKKIGSLSNDEWEEMKHHTVKGYSIALLTPDIIQISNEILSHHERYDGYGYPDRLSGDSIPLLSRAISIVVYYDDLIHKKSKSSTEAISTIKRYSGSRFDPDIVREFSKIIESQQPELSTDQDFMAFIQSQLN